MSNHRPSFELMHTENKENQSLKNWGPHKIVMEHWIDCAPFERLLGMCIEEAENGCAKLTMPFVEDLAQGAGLMHGGALFSLADTAVVMAIKSLVPPKTHFATISCQNEFLYPIKQGLVTALATAEISGDRLIHGTARLYNEEMRPVMDFKSLFKIAVDGKIRVK